MDRARPAPEGDDHVTRLAFVTAVGEIGANIVRHAYPPDTPGTVRLRLRFYPDRLELRFTDRGRPYPDPQPPIAPPMPATDTAPLPEGGRGLSLATLALDDLRYHRTPGGQNRWRLIKRLP